MIDVKTMDLLKAFYEANGYLFEVVDVTTFKEIRRDGTIKIRESFRAHIAKTDSRVLMTKDDTSILMGGADAERNAALGIGATDECRSLWGRNF